MPYYEVLCLAQGRLARTELRDVVRKACRSFMAEGGIVTRVHPMGTDGFGPRKLAYRIRAHQRNHDTGYFVNVCAFATPQALAEVDRRLKLDERILRHKTLRLPLSAALAPPPDMDEQLTRPNLDETDPSYALAQLVEQHTKDFPDGFRFAAGASDPVEELKAATSPMPKVQ